MCFIIQHGPQPPLDVCDFHVFPAGIILHLIFADFSDSEIFTFRVGEIQPLTEDAGYMARDSVSVIPVVFSPPSK